MTRFNARSPCPFRPPSSGARRAACNDEEACGEEAAYGNETACVGCQETDGAGELLPPPVATAACLTHPGQSVLFIRPLTPPSNTPQQQGFKPVVAKKAVNKKTEQARRRSSRYPVTSTQQPAPRCPCRGPTSRAPAHISIGIFRASVCSTSVHFLPHLRHTAQHTPDLDPRVSLECRTSKSSPITISGAHSKSPRRSSTRTTMLRRQWRRSQCGRHAGHACSLPGTALVAQPALLGFGTCVLMAIPMPSALSEFL